MKHMAGRNPFCKCLKQIRASSPCISMVRTTGKNHFLALDMKHFYSFLGKIFAVNVPHQSRCLLGSFLISSNEGHPLDSTSINALN